MKNNEPIVATLPCRENENDETVVIEAVRQTANFAFSPTEEMKNDEVIIIAACTDDDTNGAPPDQTVPHGLPPDDSGTFTHYGPLLASSASAPAEEMKNNEVTVAPLLFAPPPRVAAKHDGSDLNCLDPCHLPRRRHSSKVRRSPTSVAEEMKIIEPIVVAACPEEQATLVGQPGASEEMMNNETTVMAAVQQTAHVSHPAEEMGNNEAVVPTLTPEEIHELEREIAELKTSRAQGEESWLSSSALDSSGKKKRRRLRWLAHVALVARPSVANDPMAS